jgi:hypothetical protein
MFEEELQALVNKYQIKEVEISYKKTIILSANSQKDGKRTENNPKTKAAPVEEITSEEEERARRYATGPIGNIKTI